MNKLLLLSGNEIPFPEAQVTIHPPKIKEIAYIGEEAFFVGCGLLDFSKNILADSDKDRLSNYDDFDILMSIMIDKKNKDSKHSVDCALLVLSLIFPLYQIEVRINEIALKKDQEEYSINKKNFFHFKKILSTMFNLKSGQGAQEDYDPKGDMAKRIAEKFKKRHEKLMKLQNEKSKDQKEINILNRYISILAVGLQKDLNDLMQYTIYQLYDEFQRFQLKMQWDAYLQARMAGAKDLEEVDNWMIDLQDIGTKQNKK